jgi:hypothetical protein
MSAIQPVTVLTLATALTLGQMLALLSRFKHEVIAHPERATHDVSWLLFLLNVLLLPIMLLAGLLVDLLGVRFMLIASCMVLSLSLLTLSTRLAYWRTLIAVQAGALGAAVLSISTLVLLSRGLFGRDEVASSLMLGMVFVALGAAISTPLYDVLQHALGTRRTLGILALVQIVPSFLLLAVADDLSNPHGLGQLFQPLSDPAVWAAGLTLFTYAPLEAFISVWTVNYLGLAGEKDSQSRWIAWFWLGIIGSRAALALLLHFTRIGDINNSLLMGAGLMRTILVLLGLFSAVVLGNLIGATKLERAAAGLIVLGFVLGPIYPLQLGLLLRLDSMREAPLGCYFALTHLVGSVGSLALLPLVNLGLQARQSQSSLLIPLLLALFLTAATVLFGFLAQATP